MIEIIVGVGTGIIFFGVLFLCLWASTDKRMTELDRERYHQAMKYILP